MHPVRCLLVGGIFLCAAAISGTGCSGGRKEGYHHPYLLTFRPASGKVFSIDFVPIEEPHVRADLGLGLGYEGWNLSPDRRFGLPFDADASKLVLLTFPGLTDIRDRQTFLQVADFRIDDVEMSDAGGVAILREAGFQPFKILDMTELEAPAASADLVPSGEVRELLFAPEDRFGLFLFDSPFDRIEVLDFARLDDPLVSYDLPLEGTVGDVVFFDPIPGGFVTIEEGVGRFLTLRYVDRDTTSDPIEGSLDLGDSSLVHIALLHASPRAVVGGASGRLFVVDLADFAVPVLVSTLDLLTSLEEFRILVSPDDRTLAIGEVPTGRVFLYNIEAPESPTLVAAFQIGAELSDLLFSSDGIERDYRRAPSLLVMASGGLSLVDLSDPYRPLLGPSVAFPLQVYFPWAMRSRLFVSGLEDDGKVATYEVTNGEQAELKASVDLGVGGGLSRSKPGFQ